MSTSPENQPAAPQHRASAHVDLALVATARTDSSEALATLVRELERLDSEVAATHLAAPSVLDGWTHAHVVAHTTAVGRALARQAEYAARGARVEVYDGGAEGRTAGIEAGVGRTRDEHLDELRRLAERQAVAWPAAQDAAGWAAPSTYRDGTVADALLAWWREVRIHAVDAGVGIGLDSWPTPLHDHLVEFLGSRVPDDVTLVGAPGDVAAWLAGREPSTLPTARRDGVDVELPELGPWPSR